MRGRTDMRKHPPPTYIHSHILPHHFSSLCKLSQKFANINPPSHSPPTLTPTHLPIFSILCKFFAKFCTYHPHPTLLVTPTPDDDVTAVWKKRSPTIIIVTKNLCIQVWHFLLTKQWFFIKIVFPGTFPIAFGKNNKNKKYRTTVPARSRFSWIFILWWQKKFWAKSPIKSYGKFILIPFYVKKKHDKNYVTYGKNYAITHESLSWITSTFLPFSFIFIRLPPASPDSNPMNFTVIFTRILSLWPFG